MFSSKSNSQRVHTCQHLEIRNQDTFNTALTTLPPRQKPKLPIKPQWLHGSWKPDRPCTALHSEIHEPFIRTSQINKVYFSPICRKKKTWKNTDLCLKYYFKNRNITGWNSRKSVHPDFWRFWKSKIGTVLIKSGRLAGTRVQSRRGGGGVLPYISYTIRVRPFLLVSNWKYRLFALSLALGINFWVFILG